jgi:hypothetical protein
VRCSANNLQPVRVLGDQIAGKIVFAAVRKAILSVTPIATSRLESRSYSAVEILWMQVAGSSPDPGWSKRGSNRWSPLGNEQAPRR